MNTSKFCSSILIFLFMSATAAYTKNIVIDSSFAKIPIGNYMEYLVDDRGTLSFTEILDKKNDGRWTPARMDSPGFGYTRSVYWVRFTIENKTGTEAEWYIEEAYPLIGNMVLYCPGDPGFRPVEAGYNKPFGKRTYDYRTFIFPIKVNPQSAATCVMRFETESPMNMYLYLWSPAAYKNSVKKESILNWMFYGIMLIMVVYNLFIFLSIRDRGYLYYILYIASTGLFLMSMGGMSFQYLWPDVLWWARMSIPVLEGMVNFSILLFAFYYINPRQYPYIPMNIIITIALRVMTVISLVCVLAALVINNFFISMILASSLTCMNTIIGMIFIAYYIIRYKSREAWFFLAGFIVFIIGALLFSLKDFSVIPASFVTLYTMQIGMAINVVLLSFALGDRINIGRRKLEEINRNLEDMVSERTDELHAAMEELKATNDQLVEIRDSLWAEMEIAKKIQTVLLPKDMNIPGYEISAYMDPSAMVGGDYYDIISAAGSDWLVIGDVSGHGVSAGLVMMMTQTLINFVVTENPGRPPSQMLGLINKTLIKNIRLMNEDKYMTITLLASIKDGKFQFSGLHQDIMIYRERTGKVDLVETRGGWLGLDEFHADDFSDDSLYLDIEDVMLLYTDGITEAWRKDSIRDERNPEDDMFGDKRLMDILSRAGHGKPEEIKTAILNGLKDYTCDDDVTLIVVKRVK